MRRLTLLLIAWTAATAGAQPPESKPTPVSDALRAEAEKLRSAAPDRWAEWDQQLTQLFDANDKVRAEWMKRSAPPRPDAAALNLPLPYLVWRWDRAESRRQGDFISAIAVSEDLRRIDFLLEQQSIRPCFTPTIVTAMTEDRAPEVIQDLLRQPPRLKSTSLLPSLLARFAESLPPPLQHNCYEYLRQAWPRGPHEGEGTSFWSILLKLDGLRARRELADYLSDPTDQFYAVRVLHENPGRSDELAAAARKALEAGIEDWWINVHLRIVLLCAAPEREVELYVAYLDTLLAKIEGPDYRGPLHNPADYLPSGLLAHAPQLALPALRRYATDTRISAVPRFAILQYLVRQNDPQAEETVRRWLATDNDTYCHWVRTSLPQWGDTGHDLAARLFPPTSQPSTPQP